MWFRNLQVYRLGQAFDLTPEVIEERLQGAVFSTCRRMDMQSTGWTPPLGRGASALVHAANGFVMICARREDKIIPAGVVKQLLEDRVAEIQAEEDREIHGREKRRIKEDIIVNILPHALSRITDQYAYLDLRNHMLVVDANTPARAEALISQLRTSLGTLAVVPVRARQSPCATMTGWLSGGALPSGVETGLECELRHPDPAGGVLSCKHQDLVADEIRNHIKHGKHVVRLALQWKERLSFVLHDDLSIKRLRFEDITRETDNEALDGDAAAQFDLDFSLMTLELAEFLPHLFELLGGEEQQPEGDAQTTATAA